MTDWQELEAHIAAVDKAVGRVRRPRVQIPAYTDRWMRGDHYGEIVKITKRTLDRNEVGMRGMFETEIAHVKLDKSGKVVRVILDHCTAV